MPPQILIISQHPRIRKVYHSLFGEIDLEAICVPSVGDGLAQLAMRRLDAIIVDDSLPIFEVLTMLGVLEKKPGWATVPLLAVGYPENGHVLPKHVRIVPTPQEAVSLVQAKVSTL